MKLRLTITFLALALGLPFARAQWQATTYNLRGGWNGIYLHGDATHATIDELFASSPAVIAVWRWNPYPNQVQFGAPLNPNSGTPEWTIWRRGLPTESTLSRLSGPDAYVIQCSGAKTDTLSVAIPQKILPPRSTWVRNGANLLGFPVSTTAPLPTLTSYFATFPVAVAANVRVFKYDGGDLGPNNPVQVFSPASEPLDRNKAYWFEAAVVGDFYAPLEITPSSLDGLSFGRTGSVMKVRVRNRTAAAVTLTITPTNSAPAPTGQEAITGSVPLTRRTFDAATVSFVDTSITAAYTEVIPPQTSVELTFGVDRSQMTAATSALYASFLRFTDGGNLMDIALPATARVASLAGLWVGDIALTGVGSKVPGANGTTTSRSFPLRVLLHVDDTGTARLLSQVFLGRLAAAPNDQGLCTREIGLKADEKSTAMRLVATHMPLDTEISGANGSGSGTVALGGTLVRTITVPFNDRTNPFVHAYHPDHDNKDARFQPVGNGIESWTVSRECRFQFFATPPPGTSAVGWGAAVLGGAYRETISGLHKSTLTVTGSFELRRISEIGSITLN